LNGKRHGLAAFARGNKLLPTGYEARWVQSRFGYSGEEKNLLIYRDFNLGSSSQKPSSYANYNFPFSGIYYIV
jgi:hypothetical protein